MLAAYGEVLEWAETHEIWDAERRAGLILAGLGLDGVARGRKLESLSGGERSRLALAELLLRRPRALLLDEPTNHLSLALVEELEEALRTAPGAGKATNFGPSPVTERCLKIPAKRSYRRRFPLAEVPRVGSDRSRYYDSALNSLGAADDGAGVVTMYLEQGRAGLGFWE